MNEEQLKEVKGGLALSKIAILGGVVVFLIGLVDGFINPSKCNK